MALETATYLNTLVPTNPVHTDAISQADGHLRLLKSVLQATFPALSGAVGATAADLSTVAGGGKAQPNGAPLLSIVPGTSTTYASLAVNGHLAAGDMVAAGAATVGSGLVVSGGAVLSGGAVVSGSVTATSGLVVSGGAVISGGINTIGAGINVGSGGFSGPVGVAGQITATGNISAGTAFQGGTGQLVPQAGVILYPVARGTPAGYADATAFIGPAPVPAYKYFFKT